MIQSSRVLWRGLKWNQPLNFNWSAITADSVVHISVSEAKRIYGMYLGNPLIERFLGDAQIEVRNVSPHQGGVTFFIYVDWKEPLDITTDITVFDPPVQVHDVHEKQTWSLSGPSLGTKAQQFLMDNLSQAQARQLQQIIREEAMVPPSMNPSGKMLSSRPKKKQAKRRKG